MSGDMPNVSSLALDPGRVAEGDLRLGGGPYAKRHAAQGQWKTPPQRFFPSGKNGMKKSASTGQFHMGVVASPPRVRTTSLGAPPAPVAVPALPYAAAGAVSHVAACGGRVRPLVGWLGAGRASASLRGVPP